jgi:hypothetical protein
VTVRQAIDQADARRPGNPFDEALKQQWLRQADGQIRREVVEHSATYEYEEVGADRAAGNESLTDETELLVPAPYDAVYVHWLCGQIDLALGETERYLNEAQQFNSLVTSFGGWMRRRYLPKSDKKFRW